MTGVSSIQAGYTDFSVGLIRNVPVMIPLELLIKTTPRMMKRKDHNWLRLLQSTGQPTFLDNENQKTYIAKENEREDERKKNYLDVKMEMLQVEKTGAKTDKFIGAAGSQNY